MYGETDARVNASIPTVEQNLGAAGVPFQAKDLPRRRARLLQRHRGELQQAAATAAWTDTLAWLNAHMGG